MHETMAERDCQYTVCVCCVCCVKIDLIYMFDAINVNIDLHATQVLLQYIENPLAVDLFGDMIVHAVVLEPP